MPIRISWLEFARVPWLEYAIVWILRRKVGLYTFDLEPIRDFWRDGPMSYPPRFQHLILSGAWGFVLLASLAIDLAWSAVAHVLGASAGGVSWLRSYVYSAEVLLFVYHLVCALIAARGPIRFWRWTSSAASEFALLLIAVPLAFA